MTALDQILPARIVTTWRRFSVLEWLLLTSLFCATFTKLYWESFGKVTLSTIIAIGFIVIASHDRWKRRDFHIPREIAIGAVFAFAFLLVCLTGFLNIDTEASRTQFYKGLVIWTIGSAFMLLCALVIAERGAVFARSCLLALLAGVVVNAGYGFLQLLFILGANINLDNYVLTPLQFSAKGTRGIQYWGADLWRMNGFMRDTNHFGVMLAAPIPIAMTALRGKWRTIITSFLVVALLASLSRSGFVGMVAGLCALAWVMRKRLWNKQLGIAVAGVAIAAFAFPIVFPEMWYDIVVSRLDFNSGSSQTHIKLYGVIGPLLAQHPFFGLGLNTFAVHFADLSGRQEFGPHSYYIKLLTESGVVGFAWFISFACFMLTTALRVGKTIAYGLGAALVATWAANLFYLTTDILYVPALYGLLLAAPAVWGHTVQSRRYASSNADSPTGDEAIVANI